MKQKLMEILVCPVCKGKLQLKIDTQNGDEIVTGSLSCTKCSITYPIKDSIPRLLPPEKK